MAGYYFIYKNKDNEFETSIVKDSFYYSIFYFGFISFIKGNFRNKTFYKLFCIYILALVFLSFLLSFFGFGVFLSFFVLNAILAFDALSIKNLLLRKRGFYLDRFLHAKSEVHAMQDYLDTESFVQNRLPS